MCLRPKVSMPPAAPMKSKERLPTSSSRTLSFPMNCLVIPLFGEPKICSGGPSPQTSPWSMQKTMLDYA